MTKQEMFIFRINNMEDVRIATVNRKDKLLRYSFMFVLFLLHVAIIALNYSSLLAWILTTGSFLFLALFFTNYFNSFCEASIKGNSLILKKQKQKNNLITELRHTRMLGRQNIGGIQITKIKFSLDGKSWTIRLKSKANESLNAYEAINSAKLYFS